MTVIAIGPLQIDVVAGRVAVTGLDVLLRPLDLRILSHLARFHDRTQSRRVIADAVWGEDSPVDLRSIDASVTRIRRALGDAGDAIVSVRRVGYRFDPNRLPRMRGAS